MRPIAGIEDLLFPEPDELEDLVVGQLATSALFASRFRENAARALLLPRRRPGTRTPLWQQRQRAADLLAVASRYGSFPILVETYRECLSDVFDLPGLREILAGVARREIAVHGVETARASPFASSLMFDYVAAYMYDGDTPMAERRAGALTLDRDLLRELLGQEELRELLDPDALADLELSLQALTEDRQATTLDGVHDLLRRLGDLSSDEVAARTEGGAAAADPWLAELESARRAVRTRIAGDDRWLAIEDVARYRDGVGIAPPVGIPAAFLGPAVARARRPARALRADPRPVPDARIRPAAGDCRSGSSAMRSSGCSRPAPCCVASSGRAAPNANGATPRSSASCAAARWRASGARSSRSTRPRWAASCPTGRASRRSARGVPGRRYVARPPSNGSPRSSTSWPACRSRRRSSSGMSCPRGSPATSRASSMSSGRSARSPGWGGGASGATTGGSRWSGPAARSCARSGSRTARNRRWSRGTSPCASTWPRAAHRSTASCSPRPGGNSDREVLDALWDLVWAGEVTNDTFAPLRALRWKRTGCGARRNGGRGRLTALGPPEAAGRWSLVAPEPAPATATERLHAQSLALLERHGVVTREAVATEGIDGGFAAVYPVLRAMEDAGRIRRGYFVDGLGAAQFALAGALDRLRAVREPAEPAAEGEVHLLAAADPANPYGAALPWPRRGETDRRPLQRAAGAYVVLVDGVAALYLERGGATLQTLPAADDPAVAVTAARALRTLVDDGRIRELVLRKIDGEDVAALRFPAGPARRRVRGRLPRPRPPPAARPTPECPRATRSSGRRRVSGRTSSAGPSPRRGPRARAPSPRWPASSVTRSPRSSRSARTC